MAAGRLAGGIFAVLADFLGDLLAIVITPKAGAYDPTSIQRSVSTDRL